MSGEGHDGHTTPNPFHKIRSAIRGTHEASEWAVTSPSGPCLLAPVGRVRPEGSLGWGEAANWPAAVELNVQPFRPAPPIPGLTVRQEQILNYVRGYIAANGYPPSFRDIMAATGLQSPSAVRYQLDALTAKGWLELPPARTARGLRLVRGGVA